jgi:hypothetical protein
MRPSRPTIEGEIVMKVLPAFVAIGSLALVLGAVTPALAAATQQQCQGMLEKADANKDGVVNEAEGAPYMDAMKKAKLTMADPKAITSSEFMAACQADTFASLTTAQ